MDSRQRVRARALGVAPGVFATGALNAITDVQGVAVGHVTLIEGESIRTGVTAILPHAGDPYIDRVPAAIHAGNGFGKLVGSTQVDELGELETPIVLTNTLAVWRAADALAAWMLRRPGMRAVRSINPVVGETNDGVLNDIRQPRVGAADVEHALAAATTGAVEEGCVGAGTGTVAFGWKGGIGTSSRTLPASIGGATIGVLVQANFDGVLDIAGVPVGIALGRHAFSQHVRLAAGNDGESASPAHDAPPAPPAKGDGSVMIVVATDAPLSSRNLRRLAARSMMGLGRTGSCAANGSGDYAIAFCTAPALRRNARAGRHGAQEISNAAMTPLFQAVVEATEEAVYNALFMATTMTGNGLTVEAIPLDRVRALLAERGQRAR